MSKFLLPKNNKIFTRDLKKSSVFFFYKVLPNNTLGKVLTFKLWVLAQNSKEFSLILNYFFYAFLSKLKFLRVINGVSNISLYMYDRSFVSSKLLNKFYYCLISKINTLTTSQYFGWLYTLNFIGLGYKVFLYQSFLYVKLGFCRVVKIAIPKGIFVFSRKKNRLLLVSNNYEVLYKFIFKLKGLRKFNFYKGKGLFEYSSFDGIKLKVGKQQQFY